MGCTRRLALWLFGIIVAVGTLAFAIGVGYLISKWGRTHAQSLEEGRAWIHVNGRACCPHDSCFPAPLAVVGPLGWTVPGLAGSLPPNAARLWPFSATWACYYKHDPAKTLKCVFAPPPEMG